jgi:hypothetical protein
LGGLSVAASIIAAVTISAKIISICYQYPIAVKDEKDDIERVQRKVRNITHHREAEAAL